MRVVHLHDRGDADGKSPANRFRCVDEAHATRQGTTLHLPSDPPEEQICHRSEGWLCGCGSPGDRNVAGVVQISCQ